MSELAIDEMNKQRKPSNKKSCLYHSTVSKEIKDFSTGESYTNIFEHCNKMKKRIGKKTCESCKLYKPLINTNGENERQ